MLMIHETGEESMIKKRARIFDHVSDSFGLVRSDDRRLKWLRVLVLKHDLCTRVQLLRLWVELLVLMENDLILHGNIT